MKSFCLHFRHILFFVLSMTGICQAQQSALDIGRLEQVSLTVSNIDNAKKFYGDKLGLRKIFSQENLVIYDLGGTRLLLGLTEANKAPATAKASSATLYLRCADLKLCIEKLEDNGVKFHFDPEFVARQPAYDLWLMFFDDPDGNSLALMSEAPRGYNPITGELHR